MKKIIIFFGPPGSGKGTQSDILAEKLKLPVISPGELLRHEREKKTEIGLAVEKKMAKGQLLPDKLVADIIDKRLVKRDTKNGFVFDGYPRRLPQLKTLMKKLEVMLKDGDLIKAVYIKVSDREVKNRITGRRVCDCGAAYHLQYNPPKKKDVCDLCGKKLEIRSDDKPEIMKDRLATFHHLNRPMTDYFKKRKQLIVIDGEQHIDEIEKEIYSSVVIPVKTGIQKK